MRDNLIVELLQGKGHIYYVSHIKYSFIGMNAFAALSHGIIWTHSIFDIEIKRGLPEKVRLHTIRHELIERNLMLMGYDYRIAHRIALRHEKDNLSMKQILSELSIIR